MNDRPALDAMNSDDIDAVLARGADRLALERYAAKSPLQQLTERIAREGLHLHYSPGISGWRTVKYGWKDNPDSLCGTQACFRLRLRNFEAES